jgi:hypothetical protein
VGRADPTSVWDRLADVLECNDLISSQLKDVRGLVVVGLESLDSGLLFAAFFARNMTWPFSSVGSSRLQGTVPAEPSTQSLWLVPVK